MQATGERIGVGALVARSFRLLFSNFGFLFPLAFVPATALAALNYALLGAPDFGDGPGSEAFDPAAPVGFGGATEIVALFLSVLLGFVLTGVMCLAALDAAIGKRHTVGEYLAQTMRHVVPIVVIGVVLSIATGLGMLALVVPGLYVIARFLPWAPAIVFEDAGWSGLGRAQELTEGYRWPLVGATLLMGAVLIGLLALASPIAVAAAGSIALGVLFEGLISGFYYALIAVFTALVYVRLREIKEGLGAAELARTID